MDKQYWVNYHNKLRQEFIEILGGKCVKCGSTAMLEFDHIDPNTKSFNITKFPFSKERMLIELKKCQLLCKPCHTKKTNPNFVVGKHGTTMYSYGCRCEVCRKAESDYHKTWRRTQVVK